MVEEFDIIVVGRAITAPRDVKHAAEEFLEELSKEGKFALPRLDELRRKWDSLRREFDVTTTESKKLSFKVEQALEKLDYSMIAPLIAEKVNLLRKRYAYAKVVAYLDQLEGALCGDLDRFKRFNDTYGHRAAMRSSRRWGGAIPGLPCGDEHTGPFL
jgi:hypothetical protein